MKIIIAFVALLLFSSPFSAQAEYRVFLLKISKKNSDPKNPGTDKFLESTLDPEQYRGYFNVPEDEYVTYTDTWRCYGRTSNQPLCPNPKRQPSSAEGLDSAADNTK